MTNSAVIFDRALVRRRRDRAAARFDSFDFLYREIGDRLLDRLDDVRRDFPTVLELGCRTGLLGRMAAGRAGIRHWISGELSPAMAALAPRPRLVLDEEFLPVAPASLDLVLSNLSLHWVNDLPGALFQIRQALTPDGLLLAAIWGGETLIELRDALFQAELAESGGVSPHVSPFADLRDAGMLLQRAGFALPVIDSDRLTVTYPDMFALMRDLRGMGEGNAVLERSKRPLSRAVLARAAARYAEEHAGPDGRVTAAFQAIFLTGWAPADTQQKPLRPGSAKTRLASAFDAEEN
jgi:NADH dehydrogenase [ubiquinone] 1 alpha subcomplex assembly factor 5